MEFLQNTWCSFLLFICGFENIVRADNTNFSISLYVPTTCVRNTGLQTSVIRKAVARVQTLMSGLNTSLFIDIHDSCHVGFLMDSMNEMVARPSVIGIIGPASEIIFKSAVMLAHINNKPIITYSCIQNLLNIETLTRVLPTSQTFNLRFAELLLQFRWSNITFIFTASFKWWTYVLEAMDILRSNGFIIDQVRDLIENQDHNSLVNFFQQVPPTSKGWYHFCLCIITVI